ncbi:Nicotinamide/nicotinic acid mononucleotide adenylyltransferase 1 [Lecanora helva]
MALKQNSNMNGEFSSPPGTPPANDVLSTSLENYVFPHGKLMRKMRDSSRTPLVLVACGSFSPPTFLHLRMFEIASDYARDNTDFEVIGGYMSPVSSAYKKDGLVAADARVDMCSLATQGHQWLSVDNFEALNPVYVPTAQCLDHFNLELEKLGGIETENGQRKKIRVALLAGADLISTFGTPGVWDPKDLDHILGTYGCFILERMGTNIDESLVNLQQWITNIWFINQPIMNDVSSTKIRLFLKKEMSIRYLIPTEVINYIYEHGLFDVKNGLANRDARDGGSNVKDVPAQNVDDPQA